MGKKQNFQLPLNKIKFIVFKDIKISTSLEKNIKRRLLPLKDCALLTNGVSRKMC